MTDFAAERKKYILEMRLNRCWNSKWEISAKCVCERCRSISERKTSNQLAAATPKLGFSALSEAVCDFFWVMTKQEMFFAMF